jgi:hypothetical protein
MTEVHGVVSAGEEERDELQAGLPAGEDLSIVDGYIVACEPRLIPQLRRAPLDQGLDHGEAAAVVFAGDADIGAVEENEEEAPRDEGRESLQGSFQEASPDRPAP